MLAMAGSVIPDVGRHMTHGEREKAFCAKPKHPPHLALLRAPGNEAARLHLKYDAWNRLVQVRNDANGEPNDLIAIYRYDGLNRRVRKLLPDANGTAYDFYNNEAWQVLQVRKDANAAPYKQYVWDIRYVDAPVLRWCDHNPPSSRRTGLRRAGADGDFDLGAKEIVYYVNDAQFNTTAIVDPPTRPEPLRRAGANSAKVLERYRYGGQARLRPPTTDSGGQARTAGQRC